jgi:VWFA-related protein
MRTLYRAVWILVVTILPSSSDGNQMSCLYNFVPCSTELCAKTLSDLQNQQNPKDFSLKINVDLVTVDTIVRDRRGTAIGNLTGEDFLIYDNGIAQPLTHFSRDRLPLAVALVIDRSGSVGRYLPDLCSAGISALERLKPQDQVVLYAFDECPSRLTELTDDRGEVADKIGEIKTGRSTNIYGSIFEAARFLRQKAPGLRRAIVLISDNQSTLFPMADKDVLTAVLESSVALFSIRTPGDNAAYAGDPGSIERIAKESGGEVMKLGSAEKLSAALDRAISNLRMGYTLGFSPAKVENDHSLHRLSVKMNPATPCPGCRVQARNGYYAGSSLARAGISVGIQIPPYNCAQFFAEAVASNRMWVAAGSDTEYRQVALQAGTELTTDARGKQMVRVSLRIGPAGVGFKTIDDRHVGRVDVAVIYADTKGKYIGEDWQTADLQLQDDAFQEALQSGINLSVTIPFKTQGQIVKVVVCDVWSGRLASRLLRMR